MHESASRIGESKEERGPLRSPESTAGYGRRQSKQDPKQKQNQTRQKDQSPVQWTSSVEAGSLCANELRRSCKQAKTNQSDITLQQDRSEGAKHRPISSAETQDPPRQDPGDRTEKPYGQVHLHSHKAAMHQPVRHKEQSPVTREDREKTRHNNPSLPTSPLDLMRNSQPGIPPGGRNLPCHWLLKLFIIHVLLFFSATCTT